MNIKQALQQKTDNLDSEILLGHVLKKDKAFLYAHPEVELGQRQKEKFENLIERRKNGEPVAYLVGHKEFYGLNFLVNKNVLVPRPETELLVEEAINKIMNLKSEIKNLKLVDVGTGSGCVLISILKNCPMTQWLNCYGIDICKRALKVAQKNAEIQAVKNRITFLHGNLFEPIIQEQFNNRAIEQSSNWMVVANLPYVPEASVNFKQPETAGLKFEPKKALFAGQDGLDKYRIFFEQISSLKCKPKYILCEIGDRQTSELQRIINYNLEPSKIEVKKDLAGRNRVIVIQIK